LPQAKVVAKSIVKHYSQQNNKTETGEALNSKTETGEALNSKTKTEHALNKITRY